MSYLQNIATAVPDYGYEQQVLTQFYTNSTEDVSVKRKVKILDAKSGTATRYSVLEDYGLPPEQFSFFPKNQQLLPPPTLSQRMAIFKKEALPLSIKAIRNLPNFEAQKSSITHLITVRVRDYRRQDWTSNCCKHCRCRQQPTVAVSIFWVVTPLSLPSNKPTVFVAVNPTQRFWWYAPSCVRCIFKPFTTRITCSAMSFLAMGARRFY